MEDEFTWSYLRGEEEGVVPASGDKILAAGVTASEMATCCKVLDALSRDPEAFACREMKPVRSSLQPILEARMAQQYGGKGHEGKAKERAAQAAANNLKQQKDAHDRNSIRKTALREGRSRRLEELTAGLPEDHPHHLLVPDGVSVHEIESDTVGRVTAGAGDDECGEGARCREEGGNPAGSQDGEPDKRETFRLQSCYVCKCRFSQLHHFYDRLCPACADLNFEKRLQAVNLSGERYRKERDFAEWGHRLHIIGLDLRDISAVEELACLVCSRFKRCDILINNACQTVRRPAQYYNPLVKREALLAEYPDSQSETFSMNTKLQAALAEKSSQLQPTFMIADEEQDHLSAADGIPHHNQNDGRGTKECAHEERFIDRKLEQVPSASTLSRSVQLSQVRLTREDEEVEQGGSLLPNDATDVNGQQIDLRRINSWLLKVDQVSTSELLEVMLINAIAPFVLTAKMLPLMQHKERHRYIVHVSAMEGKFYRYKTPNHPHTNMAKAALNMLTRTSAEDLQKNGIYVNSVDTGWINDENPLEKSKRYAEAANWQTAIDEIDAAARIIDPIVTGVKTGTCPSGQFLKDYSPTEW